MDHCGATQSYKIIRLSRPIGARPAPVQSVRRRLEADSPDDHVEEGRGVVPFGGVGHQLQVVNESVPALGLFPVEHPPGFGDVRKVEVSPPPEQVTRNTIEAPRRPPHG